MTDTADASAQAPEAAVLLTRSGPVHQIVLNRPARLNAINPEMRDLLTSTIQQADRDKDSRVIVITGAGRGFCAGGDLKGMVGQMSFGEAGRKRVLSGGRDLVDALLRAEKPLIAMVNGPAIGLGATIALLCDLVVMADGATIGDRHVNAGLVAGDGGALAWPLLIGPSKAKYYLMTGRLLDAKEAERIGLVSRAVPADDLRAEVAALADELAGLPPYAVQATKVSVNRILQAVAGVVVDSSLAYEHLSMHTDDHQEAVAAWVEKRPGNYVGR
jgi:enoyl-CoA hydratase